MPEQSDKEVEIQRQYYRETASDYNRMHVSDRDEHFFALSFLASALDYLEAKTVLDVGSGTGRALTYLKQRKPDVRIVGVEPVKELREIGYANGLLPAELVDGDATRLQFQEDEFDVACEFGVLHHIKRPELVVAEMLRVARKAIFISDSNNFGQGSYLARSVKQLLNLLGLWKAADFLKTRGKGYTVSEGDGLAYSYSVFNNYKQIERSCKSVHIFNTIAAGVNPYRSAGHVALLGVK
jgi:SAM-dependent methyltransferase